MQNWLLVRKNKSVGFTMMELLISVVIIGLLSGVTMRVVNLSKKRANATDAVRMSNVVKLAQAIGSYCAAEASCPPTADFADGASVLRTVYIKAMPTDTTYTYTVNATGTDFQIVVNTASSSLHCLKYNSEWGKVMDCAAVCNATYSISTTGCL
jgi:prepilin-type N-terminal cleavage/methylation domain-containing protein